MTDSEYKQLEPRLRRLANSIQNKNGVDVDDLVQHAVYCMLKSPNSYRNVMTFAGSRMIEYIRKHGFSHRKSKKPVNRVYLSDALWAEIAQREEREQEFGIDLSKLTSLEKYIITRVYRDGVKRYAVARELGLKPQSVIYKCNVALAELRRQVS